MTSRKELNDSATDAGDDPRLRSVKDVLVLLGEARPNELRANPQLLARWGNDPATRRLVDYRVAMIKEVLPKLSPCAPEDLPKTLAHEMQRRARLRPSQVLDGRNEDIGAPLFGAPEKGATTRGSLG